MVCGIDFIVITGNILRSVNDKAGNIVIPKIVIPGFCPIHFNTNFAGQTNVDRYTGNVVKPGFHCMPCILLKLYDSDS